MLNKKPIFVVGMKRGGTGLLMNLMLSHPDVTKPRGETHEVFLGKLAEEPFATRWAKRLRYLPIALMQGSDIFYASNLKPRKPFTSLSKKLIDQTLFDEKLRSRDITQNYFKFPNTPYNDEEIRKTRLLTKNVTGLAFLTDQFRDMYPDATFIGIVRNGYAVFEGHIRRGEDHRQSAITYQTVTARMIADGKRYDNYHLVKFEDLVSNPLDTLKRICQLCDLDYYNLKNIRIITVPITDKDGSHRTRAAGREGELAWYDISEIRKVLFRDVNENQTNRLTDPEKKLLYEIAGDTLEELGYT